jgi:hypothetical protein
MSSTPDIKNQNNFLSAILSHSVPLAGFETSMLGFWVKFYTIVLQGQNLIYSGISGNVSSEKKDENKDKKKYFRRN